MAHRDLHFRLLRFNLVADIQTSILNFMECGGVKALKKLVDCKCRFQTPRQFLNRIGEKRELPRVVISEKSRWIFIETFGSNLLQLTNALESSMR